MALPGNTSLLPSLTCEFIERIVTEFFVDINSFIYVLNHIHTCTGGCTHVPESSMAVSRVWLFHL